MYLPEAFEDKMKNILGDEYDAYISCYDEPRYYGLRVNTKKITTEEFEKICPFEIKKIPWIENGYYYDGDKVSPAKHPYYFAGLYYLQEPSAMTPANRLPVEPGDRVLDVCAAPGGKATELGARLKGEGVLIANDISSSRAKGLLKNIEVFGIGNVLVLSEEPGKLTGYFNEYFDKILIDAPCSGEGMFRKDKKMVKAWEEHGPAFFSKLQRSIIMQAADMLRPGGLLLYSTCTFDGLENEGTIGYLLDHHPEFEIEKMIPYEGFEPGIPSLYENGNYPQLSDSVRIFPHKMRGEGHFITLLRKNGVKEETVKETGKRKGKKLPEELEQFISMIDWNCIGGEFDPGRIDIHGERVYYMPEGLPDVAGIRFLRTGLLMGELKKNRFEPSQALAMCLDCDSYPNVVQIDVNDDRIVRYLKGETIDVEDVVSPKEKGWYLFCVDQYPLGWGKLSGGLLKNKYLPGWRWQ